MLLIRDISLYNSTETSIIRLKLELESEKLETFFEMVLEDFQEMLIEQCAILKSWPKAMKDDMSQEMLFSRISEQFDSYLELAIEELQCGKDALTVPEFQTIKEMGTEELTMKVIMNDMSFSDFLMEQVIHDVQENSDTLQAQLWKQVKIGD